MAYRIVRPERAGTTRLRRPSSTALGDTATVLAVAKSWGRIRAAGLLESDGDEFGRVASLYPHTRSPALQESIRTATYTFDAFSSPDGYGSRRGYWGKQGPALLDHRLAPNEAERRMVFGATTYRQFVRPPASRAEESGANDSWVTRMRSMPARCVDHTGRSPRLAERDRRER